MLQSASQPRQSTVCRPPQLPVASSLCWSAPNRTTSCHIFIGPALSTQYPAARPAFSRPRSPAPPPRTCSVSRTCVNWQRACSSAPSNGRATSRSSPSCSCPTRYTIRYVDQFVICRRTITAGGTTTQPSIPPIYITKLT